MSAQTTTPKLTVAQLERRWRKEQRTVGNVLKPLDTSKIDPPVARSFLKMCVELQMAPSELMAGAMREYLDMRNASGTAVKS